MTGDGVNDALALKKRGYRCVAMGITGTDVAKGTADMIPDRRQFRDDRSGCARRPVIYSNIRKFVAFLLSCNVGEILVIALITLFFGGQCAASAISCSGSNPRDRQLSGAGARP